jgi:hypothetical protein
VCGWWEGVFAKASGGARKNDTFIKLSLLGIGIKFSARVLVQIFRTPFLCGLDFLVRFEISSKPKGLFAKPPNARLLDTEAVKCREGKKGVRSFISPIHSSGAKVVRDNASFHDLIVHIDHPQGGAGEDIVMVKLPTPVSRKHPHPDAVEFSRNMRHSGGRHRSRDFPVGTRFPQIRRNREAPQEPTTVPMPPPPTASRLPPDPCTPQPELLCPAAMSAAPAQGAPPAEISTQSRLPFAAQIKEPAAHREGEGGRRGREGLRRSHRR